MRFHKIIWHADGRSRDIYGAWGWGKTRINFLISIIAPGVGHNRRTFASCPDHAWLKRGESNKVAEPPTPSAINRAATTGCSQMVNAIGPESDRRAIAGAINRATTTGRSRLERGVSSKEWHRRDKSRGYDGLFACVAVPLDAPAKI